MRFKLLTMLATATTVLSALSLPVVAQDSLVTRDGVGPADAPNSMTFRLTAYDLYSSDPATAEGYAKLFTDLINKHPGWRIDAQLQTGDSAQEQARIIEQSLAGRGPDCAMVDSYQLASFMKAGVLKPMTAYFSDEEVADLFPYVREGITDANGDIMAWWWFTSLQVLYRNTELVPDAPETWADLKAAALSASEAGVEGILFNGGRTEGTAFDWLPNFWAQGGELVDADGKPVFAEGENRAKFLAALTYFDDLVESGAAPGRVATITNYEDLLASAAAGTAAMFIGGDWQYAQIQNTLSPEDAAKWAVSPLPGPTEDQRSTGTGGWTIAALTDDPEKAAICADIAKLYAGPGNAFQHLLPTGASYYDAYDVYDGPEYDTFVTSLADGHARPGVAIYPEISNQIQIAIGDVLSGAKAPEQAMDDAFAAVMTEYELKS